MEGISKKDTTQEFSKLRYVTTGSYFQKMFIELGELLNSNEDAISLINFITSGVSNKQYFLKHISKTIELLKFHNSFGGESKLSELQKSIVKFTNKKLKISSSDNAKLILRIVKKVYQYFEKSGHFLPNGSSKKFCIYDISPESPRESLLSLRKQLESYSPNKDITQATTLFISSKKVEKNYLRCFVMVFSEIAKINTKWSPSAIKQGITSYRDSFDTENSSLNTKYHEVSRVLELFTHLKNIGLIDKNCVFPKNIKKPSSSNLMRSTNPTISELNIDKLSPEKHMSSAQDMIKQFYNDLKSKLDNIVTVARNIILSYYKTYEASKSDNKLDGLPVELIVAMQIVIVDEMGINPTPLYNLKVTAEQHTSIKREFLKIEADGLVRINAIKWRQRRLQKRSTEPSNFPPSAELDIANINSSFCIQFAILVTDEKRNRLNTNLLWITDTQKKLRKDNAFDQQFREFCNKHLSKDFSKLKPTLMRIRSSRAIEIYIESDGDVVKTATYLGNKVKTTLSTYIPTFLQEVIYRRKISVFQHLYLILATANESEKLKMLGMSGEEYNKCIKEIYKNEDLGGPLFEKLKPKPNSKNNTGESEVFFICSPQNFAFAIKLLRTSKNENSEVYKVCLNAINKASSGNIMQKKMVLEAEEMLERLA